MYINELFSIFEYYNFGTLGNLFKLVVFSTGLLTGFEFNYLICYLS